MGDILHEVNERLGKIEAYLSNLAREQIVKEWYSTKEVAEILNQSEYTVRENCRQHRIAAKKRPCGRGKGGAWLISHAELVRLRNEGLLPVRFHGN
jgi:hypothetical protein